MALDTLPLTLFSTCKPFLEESERIQRNALQSWSKLLSVHEIIIFGNESGVRECCQEFGLRHVEDIKRNDYGVPMLDALFTSAENIVGTDLLGYVNADIMLTKDLASAVAIVRSRFPRFLLIARRWNIEVEQLWDFSQSDWEEKLRALVRTSGSLEPVYGGIDLFIYTRSLWDWLPPFAIGRGRWDSALIYLARKGDIPVIDVTPVVTTIHQNHDYSHVAQRTGEDLRSLKGVKNENLLRGEEFIFTALNSTHVLRESGIRRQIDFYPSHVLRRLATLPALYRPFRPLVPVIRYLAPWWRKYTSFHKHRAEARRL